VLRLGGLRQHLVAVERLARHVVAEHVGQRDRVAGRGHAGTGDLADGRDGLDDDVQLAGQPRHLVLGEVDPGQPGQPDHLGRVDRGHGGESMRLPGCRFPPGSGAGRPTVAAHRRRSGPRAGGSTLGSSRGHVMVGALADRRAARSAAALGAAAAVARGGGPGGGARHAPDDVARGARCAARARARGAGCADRRRRGALDARRDHPCGDRGRHGRRGALPAGLPRPDGAAGRAGGRGGARRARGGPGARRPVRGSRPRDERAAAIMLGLAGVVLGVLALVWPDVTLLVTSVVLGVRLVVLGVVHGWSAMTGRSRRAGAPRAPRPARRWARTATAAAAVLLALAAGGVSLYLRGAAPVVDDLYAAPRLLPGEPGRLIRSAPFPRDGPAPARARRILSAASQGAGSPAVASALVVVPRDGAGSWPVVQWAHGTTGFARQCAPSLLEEPFASGAMFLLPEVLAQGWGLVATDYV